jgi:hypothetical protein
MISDAEGARLLRAETERRVLRRPSPYPLPSRFAGGEEIQA